MISLTVTLKPGTDAAVLAAVLDARFNVNPSPQDLNVLFVDGYDSDVQDVFGVQTNEKTGQVVSGPVISPVLEGLHVEHIEVHENPLALEDPA